MRNIRVRGGEPAFIRWREKGRGRIGDNLWGERVNKLSQSDIRCCTTFVRSFIVNIKSTKCFPPLLKQRFEAGPR